MAKKRVSQNQALVRIAHYIIGTDNKDYFDYIDYCDENGLDVKDIQGEKQSNHVYALSLIGLGMKFPNVKVD
jgi:hypothetical protein